MAEEFEKKADVYTSGHDVEKRGVDLSEQQDTLAQRVRHSISGAGGDEDAVEGQMYSMAGIDEALDQKMRLVNDAIDQIGWTNFHSKMFCLNGFGYMADSLLLVIQSIISGQAVAEFQPTFIRGLTFAAYAGMLVGALFWGATADIIGRRFAFNVSLFVCSVFAIVAGASPNWIVLGLFVSLTAFGAGGNLVLDTCVFLEYLPSHKQWMLTTMAAWWGLGPVIAAAFAWPFLTLPQYNCDADNPSTCTMKNNMGWRYVWFGNGAVILAMSIARVTIVRLHETPKFLLGQGRDEEVVEGFKRMATRYNRQCDLTVEQLTACGSVVSAHKDRKWGLGEIGIHVKGLFVNKKLGLSTCLIWLSWTLIGLAYPLFYVFLPQYLKSRGAQTGDDSPNTVWRDYFITNVVGIFGPILAGWMCTTGLGRRYTMVVGALTTMVFFFAYTAVRTPAQNLGFTCAIYFTVNVYYGCLYAYTPEVLPSAHRATGNGIAIGCNRVMGIISAVVATTANTFTVVPIYICAALYIAMAIVAAIMPFEPYGRRSM